jgi:hypothetical protein
MAASRYGAVLTAVPPTNASTADLSLDALLDAVSALRSDVQGQSTAFVTGFLERCASSPTPVRIRQAPQCLTRGRWATPQMRR